MSNAAYPFASPSGDGGDDPLADAIEQALAEAGLPTGSRVDSALAGDEPDVPQHDAGDDAGTDDGD